METPTEFREDAPEAIAIARERRLQACRERLRPVDILGILDERKSRWTQEHIRELRWVHALAQAGHVGAQRLRYSALSSENRADEVAILAPDLLEALAAHHDQVALSLIRHEGLKDAPDAAVLQRWLRKLPDNSPLVADAVAEVVAIRALGAGDGDVFRGFARYAFYGQDEMFGRSDEEYVADIVWFCSQKGGPEAARLAERAAELGSTRARLEYTLAGDHRLAYDDSSGPWGGELAAAIREVRALTQLNDEDRTYFRRQADPRSILAAQQREPPAGEPVRARFVYGIAKLRLKSRDPDVGERLRQRAAELGCSEAKLTR